MEKKLSGYAILAAASGVAMLRWRQVQKPRLSIRPPPEIAVVAQFEFILLRGRHPKRGVLQPREGPPIDTASERSFVPHEKRLHSG